MPTIFGILAILLWSSTIGFSRLLAEALGPLTSGALIFLMGGLLSCLQVSFRKPGLPGILRLPVRYLVVCVFLFVTYEIALYLAIGLSVNDHQVLVVGLLNYLWPALILLTAIPLLGYHASPWLGVGVVLSLAGVSLALGVNPFTGGLNQGEAWLPYLLAIYAAFAWAFYTNLSRRWLGESVVSGLPVFILLAGLVLGGMRLFVTEESLWIPQAIFSLAYLVVCVTWLAYTFWDIGSRRGNIILLGTLSYFIPLLSTLISALILQQAPGSTILLATLLLVAGAWIGNRAIK